REVVDSTDGADILGPALGHTDPDPDHEVDEEEPDANADSPDEVAISKACRTQEGREAEEEHTRRHRDVALDEENDELRSDHAEGQEHDEPAEDRREGLCRRDQHPPAEYVLHHLPIEFQAEFEHLCWVQRRRASG